MQEQPTSPQRDPITGRYLSAGMRWCTCSWCGIRFERNPSEVRTQKRQFCSVAHYNLARTRPIEERFWERVSKRPSGCWLWTGNRVGGGYGALSLAKQPHILAHRYSWELHRGPIPPDTKVLHTCDTPACVNPDHLWLGSQKDNVRDMITKGRRTTASSRLLWIIVALIERINDLEARLAT